MSKLPFKDIHSAAWAVEKAIIENPQIFNKTIARPNLKGFLCGLVMRSLTKAGDTLPDIKDIQKLIDIYQESYTK